MRYSPSSIDSYDICPFKFKLIHIDKRKEPKTAAMDRGIQIHDYLEQKGKTLAGTQKGAINGNYNVVAADISNIENNIPIIFEDMDNAEEKSFEKYIKKPLQKDIIISGKVDRILAFKDKIIVTDYKTGSYFKYAKPIKENLQYLIYCWFMLNLYPDDKRPIYFEIIQIKNGVVEKKSWKCSFSKEQIEEKLYAKIENILNDKEFIPKPNNFCNNCYFKKECNDFKNLKILKSRSKKEEDKNMPNKKEEGVRVKEAITIEDSFKETRRIEVSFSYSVKTARGMVSLKAGLGKNIRESASLEQAYGEGWDVVEKEVEKLMCQMDLEKM